MVRQLQPWFENVAKRQVKAPKVYLRDSGVLHALLGIGRDAELLAHPRGWASWEGFVVEQALRVLRPANAWFRAEHGGGEVDLLILERGRRIGVEVKFSEAPKVTRAMRNVVDALALDHLFAACSTRDSYRVDERISVVSVFHLADLPARIDSLPGSGSA